MKNRILFLLHLPPPVHGSSLVGQYIRDSKLLSQKFKCLYINLLASKSVDQSGKIRAYKIFSFVRTFSRLIIKLIFHRPNLCYLALTSTGAAFYRDVIIIAFLKLLRIKRIYHMHNKGVSRYQDRPIYSFFYKFVFKETAVIILAKSLYADIKAFVPEKNIYILPNGIPPNHEINLKRNDYGTPNILFLSNLIESKGVFVLLEALAILKHKNVHHKAILIGGEGDITDELLQKKILELDIKENVQYLGKQYGREKEEAFSQANIFVFPTYSETFGLVNIEAMQYRLPIVSTPEGGIPDIIEEGVNGFLVPQRNAQALANKLEYLILQPEVRKKMGEAGYMKYRENYTLEKFENSLLEILQKEIKSN